MREDNSSLPRPVWFIIRMSASSLYNSLSCTKFSSLNDALESRRAHAASSLAETPLPPPPSSPPRGEEAVEGEEWRVLWMSVQNPVMRD